MNNLDDDLRETLRRHAPDPDSLRPLEWTPSPAHRAPAGPRRVLVPAFAAALVLVFLVAVGAFVVTRDPTSSAPVVPVGPSPSATPTETITRNASALGGASKLLGTQDVHYRGVLATMPRSLVIDAWECGGPVEETVVIGAPPDLCPDGPHGSIADAPLVKLLPSESGEGATRAKNATTPVTVNGLRAFTDCEDCPKDSLDGASVLYLPDRRVVVTAEVYGPGTFGGEIFRSVRTVESEAASGATCPLAESESLTFLPAPSSAGPDPIIVDNSSITGGRICVYGTADETDAGSTLLTGFEVSAATARGIKQKYDAALPSASADGVRCVVRWGPESAVAALGFGSVEEGPRDLRVRVGLSGPPCTEVTVRDGRLYSADGFGVEDLLDLRS